MPPLSSPRHRFAKGCCFATAAIRFAFRLLDMALVTLESNSPRKKVIDNKEKACGFLLYASCFHESCGYRISSVKCRRGREKGLLSCRTAYERITKNDTPADT
mmetsp:Transcript_1949/g.4570  ORF Transcript_1949/g.4570 Transcript_1949/m.4570 type:complete len:103 (-) Transcript_1949:136-444(-)